jgi:hypothetical protein
MPSIVRRFALIAVIGFTVVACSSMTTQPVPELTFAHIPPIGLDVRAIEVTSAFQSSNAPPNVEYRFRTPPEVALKRWANERLRALGTMNRARFTVLNAAVTEEPLPRTTGFFGAFKTEPEARYTITVEAQLEILDERDMRLGLSSARVTRSRTMMEGLTPDDKQLFWFELTRDTMDSFDTEMERSIRQFLKQWVR